MHPGRPVRVGVVERTAPAGTRQKMNRSETPMNLLIS
jgi:hypothetical protein